MLNLIRRFIADRDGATAIEYGLIIALISLAIVAGIGRYIDAVGVLWSDSSSEIIEAFQ
jgi:pilus assembly protein Flp/PilA